MSVIQDESIQLKGFLSVTDFHAMIESMTIRDLQQLTLDCMELVDIELYTAIGKTMQPDGLVNDDTVKALPIVGMGWKCIEGVISERESIALFRVNNCREMQQCVSAYRVGFGRYCTALIPL